jgi:predicted metal-dependent enzyme (double-stranded beta helix superfamily)
VRDPEEAMFDQDQFIADCRNALAGDRASRDVREIVQRAVSDPGSVVRQLGDPQAGGIQPLHRSPELTVINVCWPANMVIMPHNHAMWAVIGVYGGREDNILWRRLPETATGKIEAAGAKALSTGEAHAFGADLIHSVVNPITRVTGAIHVYGGDFFATERSEWDPESLEERPFDIKKALRQFER